MLDQSSQDISLAQTITWDSNILKDAVALMDFLTDYCVGVWDDLGAACQSRPSTPLPVREGSAKCYGDLAKKLESPGSKAEAGALGVRKREENKAKREAGEMFETRSTRKRKGDGSNLGSIGPASPYVASEPSSKKQRLTPKPLLAQLGERDQIGNVDLSHADQWSGPAASSYLFKPSDVMQEQRKPNYLPKHLPGLLPSKVELPVVLVSKGSSITLSHSQADRDDFKSFWTVLMQRVGQLSDICSDQTFGTMLENVKTNAPLDVHCLAFPKLLNRSASLSYSQLPTRAKHIGNSAFKQFLNPIVTNATAMLEELKLNNTNNPVNPFATPALRSQDQAPAEITARLVSLATGISTSTIAVEDHERQILSEGSGMKSGKHTDLWWES